MILCIMPVLLFYSFSRRDAAILSEIRQKPHLPQRDGNALQACENIARLRKEKRMTQKDLSRISGVSHTCLRDIEHGCANVTTKTLLRIAAAFDLSLMKLTHLATPEDELMEMVYTARKNAGLRI